MNRKGFTLVEFLGMLVGVGVLLIVLFSFLGKELGIIQAAEPSGMEKALYELTKAVRQVAEGTKDEITMNLALDDSWIIYGFDGPSVENQCGSNQFITKPAECGAYSCICICSEKNYECAGDIQCVSLEKVDYIVTNNELGSGYIMGGQHKESTVPGNYMVFYGDCGTFSDAWGNRRLRLQKIVQETGQSKVLTVKVSVIG